MITDTAQSLLIEIKGRMKSLPRSSRIHIEVLANEFRQLIAEDPHLLAAMIIVVAEKGHEFTTERAHAE